MSRTFNRPRPAYQREAWSRRSSQVKMTGWKLDKSTKVTTHRIERRQARAALDKVVTEGVPA